MNAMKWGIGVPGALGPKVIGQLAALAERSGYQGFWFNCVAPAADPSALLDAALVATDGIDIGVGVIPLSGYPAATLASRLRGSRADDPRVVLGVGSGAGRRGALHRVSDGIAQLRHAVPRARIAVGGKGPRMLALGAGFADALLFSMFRPDEAHAVTRDLQAVDGRAVPMYTYHRVALDPGAHARLQHEMVSHGAWPADDVRTPSGPELLGTVLPSRADAPHLVAADLVAYPDDWRPVLRPLPRQPGELDDWLDLFRLLAPAD